MYTHTSTRARTRTLYIREHREKKNNTIKHESYYKYESYRISAHSKHLVQANGIVEWTGTASIIFYSSSTQPTKYRGKFRSINYPKYFGEHCCCCFCFFAISFWAMLSEHPILLDCGCE